MEATRREPCGGTGRGRDEPRLKPAMTIGKCLSAYDFSANLRRRSRLLVK